MIYWCYTKEKIQCILDCIKVRKLEHVWKSFPVLRVCSGVKEENCRRVRVGVVSPHLIGT